MACVCVCDSAIHTICTDRTCSWQQSRRFATTIAQNELELTFHISLAKNLVMVKSVAITKENRETREYSVYAARYLRLPICESPIVVRMCYVWIVLFFNLCMRFHVKNVRNEKFCHFRARAENTKAQYICRMKATLYFQFRWLCWLRNVADSVPSLTHI